ncbi:DUF2155 domain-containing protein [Phaeovulum sp.]|jgi:hypothetical protein|uniref:DUF2155 domain-containing protein n=1 Tax=Phaeovulum sp. TaxID=2934796 RepID=UPI002730252C|nr:DUF2155 domain-containing protein [Phaeovulum sp.]MDP1670082.1 DUF2155 domain-containing protein [Phaeovulum sp.]MDP2063041.1 DUF2155 domain-containing protein [Phaeovulum sp.]MDP3861020.1 DUF2155 domain-containing protein [Phaeovulum sp.]MDZ4118324.1 DUF2155 domain-containing protein [Phaeovulum sp.]
MIRAALAFLLLLPAGAFAQEVAAAPGAVLRALDRISGITTDLELAAGETVVYRRLSVTLAECRYPPEDPASKAFARLVIIDTTTAAEKFNGWMISDSPALSAMDDSRYDVWLIRCKIS